MLLNVDSTPLGGGLIMDIYDLPVLYPVQILTAALFLPSGPFS